MNFSKNINAFAGIDIADLQAIGSCRERGGKTVFVSGNFNVLHPGHMRLLEFAKRCGDLLVVGIHADTHVGVMLPQNLRLESVKMLSCVDFVLPLTTPPEEFIAALEPELVVKGKEHEDRPNPEADVVESYGGKLLFSSGEARFSSFDLLKKEFETPLMSSILLPNDYRNRHGIMLSDLASIVNKFKDLRVLVVGDLIVDDYITCQPLGLSQEDTTVVVTPLMNNRFIGGAGIVASHASRLGAKVQYFSVVGDDDVADFAEEKLREYGVEATLLRDESRPTTLKQRYRTQDKTLLRVSHLKQHSISRELIQNLSDKISAMMSGADLVIFSDFNYGCLPQALVDRLQAKGSELGKMMVADSQSSSQVGDISRFCGMQLVTPTEREARLALNDFESGLVVLAENLMEKAKAQNVFITLGAEGLFVHSPKSVGKGGTITDQLVPFNSLPKDTAGAGDSMLVCASMALATGADVWQSAYLGSLAAACQVARIGNTPLQARDLLVELTDV